MARCKSIIINNIKGINQEAVIQQAFQMATITDYLYRVGQSLRITVLFDLFVIHHNHF